MSRLVNIPLYLLEELAPEQPINQDEMGGCVFCGGSPQQLSKRHAKSKSIYASENFNDHYPSCAWVEARKIIAEMKEKK